MKVFAVLLLSAVSAFSADMDMAGVLTWSIPEGEVVRVEVGGEVVWPSIPYITNGLVAMWDGKWNAGVGVHDANATVWKDIAGDWDASLFGNNHWSDDAWVVESVSGDDKGYARFSCPNMPESQTWQFVVHPTNYLGFNAGSRLISITGFQPRIMATNGISMYSSYGATFGTYLPDFNALDLHAHTITHEKDSPNINYWIDGRLVYTSSGASNNSTNSLNGYFANNSALNRGLDASYYSVRLYNRVLTAAEIAAKYADLDD